jgi:hypothetical protein
VAVDRIEGFGPLEDALGVGQTEPIARAAGAQVEGSQNPPERKPKRHHPELADGSLQEPNDLEYAVDAMASLTSTSPRGPKDEGPNTEQTSHRVDDLA